MSSQLGQQVRHALVHMLEGQPGFPLFIPDHCAVTGRLCDEFVHCIRSERAVTTIEILLRSYQAGSRQQGHQKVSEMAGESAQRAEPLDESGRKRIKGCDTELRWRPVVVRIPCN